MGEKKMVTVSVGSLVFLFIVVILISIIAGMWSYISQQEKTNLNTSFTNSNTSSKVQSQITYGKEYASPKFYYKDSDDKTMLENLDNWEAESYVFEGNCIVKYYTYESTLSGTYQLLSDGIIKISLNSLDSEPSNIHNLKINLETELKIIDNDTIIGNSLEKNDSSNDNFFYWSPYTVVYSLSK